MLASRFAAQRRLIASAILLRPAGVIARFLFAGFCGGLDAIALLNTRAPATSRSAEIAQSIADRCCSRSEMILSMSFKEAP
jgi:hypothetical protein